MEQLEYLHIAGGHIDGIILEINLEVSHKVRKCLPPIPLLSICLKEMKTYIHKDFYSVIQSSFIHNSPKLQTNINH